MSEIEEGDSVSHNVFNSGLNMTVEEIKDGKALFTIDGVEHWLPIEELTLIEKANGGFREEGDDMT